MSVPWTDRRSLADDSRRTRISARSRHGAPNHRDLQPLLEGPADSDGEEELEEALTTSGEEKKEEKEKEEALAAPGQEEDEFGERKTFTVDEAVDSIGLGWFQAHIILVTCIFKVSEACQVLLVSLLGPTLRCEWLLTDTQEAFITTIVYIGMFFGSFLWGQGSDVFGRKPVVLLSASWIFYMGFLSAFSPNLAWILVLRGLLGTAFGGAIQTHTIVTEYLPLKSRAKILSLTQVPWMLGSIFVIWMASAVLQSLGWRWLIGLSSLPTLVTMLGLLSLPESARYLVAAGHQDQAMHVLQRAAKWNGRKLPVGTLVESKQAKRGRVGDLLVRKFSRLTVQVWFLWFVVAFSWYGMLLLNAQPRLLNHPHTCSQGRTVEEAQALDSCHCEPYTQKDFKTILISTVGEFAAIPFNLATLDTLGRRITLSLNFLCSALFFLLIQICTSQTMMVVFTFGVRAFTTSLFASIYLYTSEAYPTTLRSVSLGTSSAVARIGVMVTPFVAQVLVKRSLTLVVSVYGAINIVGAICAGLLPVETKGRAMPQTLR